MSWLFRNGLVTLCGLTKGDYTRDTKSCCFCLLQVCLVRWRYLYDSSSTFWIVQVLAMTTQCWNYWFLPTILLLNCGHAPIWQLVCLENVLLRKTKRCLPQRVTILAMNHVQKPSTFHVRTQVTHSPVTRHRCIMHVLHCRIPQISRCLPAQSSAIFEQTNRCRG